MLTAGRQLRMVREQLGLTMRDVEAASARLAARHNNADFIIALSRLSDIETKGVLPNIYRLYSLAAVYHRDLHEILGWFGIDTSQLALEAGGAGTRKSHLAEAVVGHRGNQSNGADGSRVRSAQPENDQPGTDGRGVGRGAAGPT